MAFLSGKLNSEKVELESDNEFVLKFFSTAERLNEFRNLI